MSQDLAHRFYKEVVAIDAGDGFAVALDGRLIKTPGGRAFRVPTRALAEAVAREWAAQGERIHPMSMPLTRFCYVALDHTPGRREAVIAESCHYAETDLTSHRAAAPDALVQRQAKHWDAVIAWAAETLDVRLPVVAGVIAAEPPDGEIAKLRAHAEALDDFRLTALGQAVGLSGSVLIAHAILRGALAPLAAYEAAALDDIWSLDQWGEDPEGRDRLDRLRAEFSDLAHYVAALAEAPP